jgi:small-conductance mechanosensitive channel
MIKEIFVISSLALGYAFLVRKSIVFAKVHFANKPLQCMALIIALIATVMLAYAFSWAKTPPVRPKPVLMVVAEKLALPVFLFLPGSLAFVSAFLLRKQEKRVREDWVEIFAVLAAIFSPIGLLISGCALAGACF